VPGVRAAGYGRIIPIGFGGSRGSIAVPGYQPSPDEDMEINFNLVSAAYFEATGITRLDGRFFAGRARHDDASEVQAARGDFFEDLRATEARHDPIGDHEVPGLEQGGVELGG
jgi:hypothetical protein